MKFNKHSSAAFTIVELLVVVVIIAVLAAISLVMYSGISQKAVASVLQSDLSNAATAIKAFQVENGNFPNSITSCPNPAAGNICYRSSSNNAIVGYSAKNQVNPKTFILVVSNGSLAYKVTDSTAPTQLAATTEPGVTPGASVELHAAKANGGASQGINSPLTTTWADTSGNNNNGTVSNYSGSPWVGAGTAGNPWGLSHTTDNQTVSFVGPSDLNSFSVEMWIVRTGTGTNNNYLFVFESYGLGKGFNIYLASNNTVNVQWNRATPVIAHSYYTLGTAALNTPAHFVLTYDGSNLVTYWNGVASAPATVGYTPDAGNAASPTYTVGPPWTQALTRVYPFTLMSSQVTANYNAGAAW